MTLGTLAFVVIGFVVLHILVSEALDKKLKTKAKRKRPK